MPDTLRNEATQRRENVGNDVVIDASENIDNLLLGNTGTVIKRYVENRIEVHIHCHFGVNRAGTVAGHYCIVFNRYVKDSKLPVPFDISQLIDSDCHSAEDIDDRVKEAMLVDVREFLELSKGMTAKIIPSVVRLQSLDDCLRRCVHRADSTRGRLVEKSLANTRTSLPVFIPEDRKLGTMREILGSADSGRVGISESVGEVIQPGSQIVENVANHDRKWIERQVVDLDTDLVIRRSVRVSLMDNGVMISMEPVADLSLQLCQVMVRST